MFSCAFIFCIAKQARPGCDWRIKVGEEWKLPKFKARDFSMNERL